jgi:hypothetical protein
MIARRPTWSSPITACASGSSEAPDVLVQKVLLIELVEHNKAALQPREIAKVLK